MNSVAIIINSCCKFYKTSILKIIDSCKKNNIPHSNIYVIVGESESTTDIIKTPDYNIAYCKYVNIDYNGVLYMTQTIYGIEELKKYTHFFYTHDTSVFLDNFWEKINIYSTYCDAYIKLQEVFTKNIGLFNVKWFIENKTELLSYYINYDKNLIMEYKKGDFSNKEIIYDKFSNLARWLNEDCLFLFTENFEPIGMYFKNNNKQIYKENVYSNDERLATVYNEPGIIKYQKNWNGTDWFLTL